MAQLETFEDIINAGKQLKQELMDTFGFHITSGEGYGCNAAYTIKKDEVMFSFPYGPVIESETRHCPVGYRKHKLEMYDFGQKKTLMTKEQFMELFRARFGEVNYEEFEWSITWGVRVALKATKAIGEIWRSDFTRAPEKFLILRKTERTIIVGTTLDDKYPQKLNLSEVIGKTYFWTYEEAYNRYKENLDTELQRLREQQFALARRIAEVERLKQQLH